MSSNNEQVNTRKRKTRESGSQEELSKMKQVKQKLHHDDESVKHASPGNTPEKVYNEMSEQWYDQNTETHITDPKNSAFKELFGDEEAKGEVEETKPPATVRKEEGGGKGFWSFLGIGGRKRRRRKKSHKKKKSKKRKSRRRKSRRKSKKRKSRRRRSRRRRR